MKENIKLILGIVDSEQDQMIDYYVDMVIRTILNLIKEPTLPTELEYVVERKVAQLVQYGYNADKVTQLDRGDYKIKFSFDSKGDKSLLSDIMGELKRYLKKVRFY
jgi:hypothetical protein